MRDFLPEDVRRREYVIGIIKRVYERYGFEPLETPAVENLETLLGKYGDEGNQLIFKILKRGEHEKTGEADLALRYDLTVPLARVVAEHQAKLPRLFKRYQIQPVWRADRPARGRFREFFQCDVDSLGSTSPVDRGGAVRRRRRCDDRARIRRVSDPIQSSQSAVVRVEACGVSGRARRRDARGPRQAGQDWRGRCRQGVGGEGSWRRRGPRGRREDPAHRPRHARRRGALHRKRCGRPGRGGESAARHRAVARRRPPDPG